MRLTGAMLLLLSGAALGLERSFRLGRRVEKLIELERTLRYFKTRIGYSSPSLCEMIASCEGALCKKAAAGENFSGDPKSAAVSAARGFFANRGDRSLAMSFFEGLGENGTQGELEHCEMYIELVKERLRDASEQRERKSRVCVGLGIFGGLSLAVILI